MDSRRGCERCLLRELPDKEYFRRISEYIKNIPLELRTNEKAYSKRLEECKKCEYLLNGMCRMCGCFVEIRAATAKRYCPDKVNRWAKIEIS
jgi:hypothetical protein